MELIKKGYNLALKYLNYKPRTEFELKEHLKNKEIDKNSIEEIIQRLKDINYINDKDYAMNYIINSKVRQKSRKQILRELGGKGLTENTILKIMDEFYSITEELEIAQLIIDKIYRSNDPLSYNQLKSKINYKLRYKQFSNDVIKQALASIDNNEDIKNKIEDSTEKLKEKAYRDGVKYFTKYEKKYDNIQIVKKHTLGALFRKGYPSNLCYEILKQIMEQSK